jgi:3-deoxy-manno-octulosonate cytidylyltransferase (CMP-KDO synthetase)
MSIIGIIPARFASTRFPGKPLAEIKGKTMLQRVCEQARLSKKLDELIVATDDERIAKHAAELGVKALMTSETHPSGTDRCYEAYRLHGEEYNYVINIQGDEPFLHPDQIDSLAAACNGLVEIVTQMIPCRDAAMLQDPGEVKIVLNARREALYFSRQIIPFIKGEKKQEEWHKKFTYYRHVGMYAYRTDILAKITALPPSELEKAESLEQLRWLERGFKIRCVETSHESHCIDNPEDIPKVLKLMKLDG